MRQRICVAYPTFTAYWSKIQNRVTTQRYPNCARFSLETRGVIFVNDELVLLHVNLDRFPIANASIQDLARQRYHEIRLNDAIERPSTVRWLVAWDRSTETFKNMSTSRFENTGDDRSEDTTVPIPFSASQSLAWSFTSSVMWRSARRAPTSFKRTSTMRRMFCKHNKEHIIETKLLMNRRNKSTELLPPLRGANATNLT